MADHPGVDLSPLTALALDLAFDLIFLPLGAGTFAPGCTARRAAPARQGLIGDGEQLQLQPTGHGRRLCQPNGDALTDGQDHTAVCPQL